jgi:hypothetical protein
VSASSDGESGYRYVYGVMPTAAATRISGTGIAGAQVNAVVLGDSAALVSDIPEPEPVAGREELRVHARVLERALELGTVLPMRFGVVMASEEAVRRDLLERHAQELAAQLAELDGLIELRVRAIYEEQTLMREVVASSPEIAELRTALRGRPADATYFERIRLGELVSEQVQRRSQHDGDEIVAALEPFCRAVRRGDQAHERVAVDASFLVDRGQREDFEQVLEGLAQAQEGRVGFRLIGPLPPHSFVAEFSAGER